MGLHTLHPQPNDSGIGHNVEKVAHGFGAIKTAYDVGHIAYDAAKFAAPYVARAGGALMQAGRAAAPVLAQNSGA